MTFDKINDEAQEKAKLDTLVPIPFQVLENGIKKWMLVPDSGVIKLLCALIIANRFKKKAVWMAFIAPSGGGKTALFDGLLKLPDIYQVSTVTPQTFLSGMPGKGDASLLPKLDGKIMLMKDFTSILSMQRDARSEIMGQLREIWDGSMKKIFGNGQIREWGPGKVSLIVASTQAIDLHQQMNTHLGERFINYRIKMPGRKEVARRAYQNDADQEKMQTEIQEFFYSWSKGINWDNLVDSVKIPDDAVDELIDLADFCTIARSGVIRDFGPQRQVLFVPAAEMPPRMVSQLSSIAAGLTAVNKGVYDPKDMQIVYKCALDSIPATNWMVIHQLAREDQRTTTDIATSIGYPTEPIKTYLENLALLKVADRIKGMDSEEGGRADKWSLKPAFKKIVNRYEKVEELSEDELMRKASEEEADKIWDDDDE